MKITLDPGHGAKGNAYPPQPGCYEGAQMWKLSQYLATELQKYGATVVTTRPAVTDDIAEVYDRGALAAKNGSDMILSLHSNAADAAVTGTETYYSIKGVKYKDLAEKLAARVSEIMGHNTRGAKLRTIIGDPKNDYYGVIRGAANNGCACAIILEHGFHTNAKDAAFLVQDENLLKLAVAEAEIISSYFGLKMVQTTPSHAQRTPIMGKSVLTAEQMSAFLLSKNPAPFVKCTPLELAKLYLSEGNAEGVRGDIAFAQAIQETGWFRFGKDVLPEQNNYCGLGATNTTAKGKGAWFDTPQLGVRAHIQHLKAYACTDSLRYTCVDVRFKYVERGVAPTFEQLGGKWAVPGYDAKAYASFDTAYDAGATYGQKILAIYADMAAFKVKEDNVMSGNTQTIQVTIGATKYIVDGKALDRDTLVYKGEAYIPAAYLADKLGYNAVWDAKTNTTTLTRKKQVT